jgi:hypothetical protein
MIYSSSAGIPPFKDDPSGHKMTLSRCTITINSVIMALVCSSPIAEAQTTPAEKQPIAAEWARKIAFTINNNPGAATSSNPIMSLVSAISRDNVVEIKYVMKDAAAFARLKQNAHSAQLGKTSFYCNASRISYLTQGVVFHEMTMSPSGDDQVELTVDRSSCDILPKITRLDPASLAKLALTVANAENDASAKEYPPNSILQFGGASAHEGIVEERFIVPTYSPTSPQINTTVVTDVSRGFLCEKYRGPLLQGISFHRTYVSKDGGLIFDFGVDGAHC